MAAINEAWGPSTNPVSISTSALRTLPGRGRPEKKTKKLKHQRRAQRASSVERRDTPRHAPVHSHIHAPSDHLAHPTRYMSCTKIHKHTRSPHGMGQRRADRTDRQVRGAGTRPRECRDRVGPLEARRATPDRGERGERASLNRRHCSAKDTAADGGGIWVALCVELGPILPPPRLPPPPRTSSGTPRRSPSCRP